ncbi:uncharacterized protein LOC126370937 [Pectinophora gossypiella]|uniref:uncharacterized protein LOC126370937 n=1 Tax=Pectinophora gossypiella TaxID=13191 RepID=UPI00214E62BD|nr:uncharacterized protein LOC126370937 [Pectinophora gossypiella]
MGKRKHKRDDKHISKKIRRLVEKSLREHAERRRRRTRSESLNTSSSEDYRSDAEYSADDSRRNADYELENEVDDYSNRPQSIVSKISQDQSLQPVEDANIPEVITPSETQPTNFETLNQSQPSTSDVPQEILSVLGVAKISERPLGEKIPSEISERWGNILLDGLTKEHKVTLIEKMLVPENFTLAHAPKLNPDVAAVLSEAAKNRDKRLEKSQNQLGSGLAGLVNLTKDLINTDLEKLETIKRISEIAQVLLDLHHDETNNRRKLIVPLLDKRFWSTIQGVKRDSFLFGERLSESIKNTKDIERSSQQIKKSAPPQQSFQRKNTTFSGNYRAPPRLPANAKPAPKYHESQTSTSTRRATTNQPRGRGAHSGRMQDRRRK